MAADTIPPIEFSITYPTQNSLVTQLSFAWSASADDTGLLKYDLYIDNEKKASVDPSYLYATLSGTLSEGKHTAYVEASDLSGNTTKTAVLTFYINTQAPSISVYADNLEITNGSTIRRMPSISATIFDAAGINTSSVFLFVDDMATSFSVSTQDASNYNIYYKIVSPLNKGAHTIRIESQDIFDLSTTTIISELQVANEIIVEDIPKNYPNPFKPKHSQSTKIAYTLSDDSDITLSIYDINGKPVKRLSSQAGAEDSTGVGLGGKKGYNEVTWDGVSDFGDTVGNGVYLYLVRFNGKTIGRGQLAVYD